MGKNVSKSISSPTQISTWDSVLPVDFQIESPRFSVNDAQQIQQGIEHLNENGYAVFSNVLSPDEITSNIDLLWKHFESLLPPYHIKRDDTQTWNAAWPGSPEVGILSKEGFGQSWYMWSVRGNPNVKKIFTEIWQTPELLVSFDAAGCFRNWHLNSTWKTRGGWYHCDQNPIKKPHRCSIQGFVSLTDNNESTGGLVVVAQSHKHFAELQLIAHINNKNFVRVHETCPLLKQFQPRLVKCKAGDLVVFDSRCIHCNTPALDTNDKLTEMTRLNKNNYPPLLRIVAYVCMSPTAMVPSDKLEEFRKMREEFVYDRMSCTHWPAELNGSGGPQLDSRQPLKLSTYQQSLIVGTNVNPDDETAGNITDM